MVAVRLQDRTSLFDPQSFVEGPRSRKKTFVALEHARGTAFQNWSEGDRKGVRVGGFGSPLTNGNGRIDLRWEPGNCKVPFGVGLKIDLSNPPRDLKVELWTNVNSDDPTHFYGVPMHPTEVRDNNDLAFFVEHDVQRTGTYTATVRVSTDGGQTWKTGGEIGAQDIVFRAVSKEFEGLNIRQLLIGQANKEPGDWRASTIEDILENKYGNYNLETLAHQGVNTIYIECPFRSDPWDNRHPVDTLGSPFAVTDYYAIDPRWSREAREIPGWDRDRQMEVANRAFKRLVDEAHNKGMKVIVGVAPNHVGHNYTFRDMFENREGGVRVERNNFSQIAVNPEQLQHVERMLQSDKVQQHEKDYAEYLFPWMYATRDDRPEGAGHVTQTMSETWYGDWLDIKKLNHGGHMAMGHKNGNSPQQEKVRDWIARWMAHAATALGIDGFRIDHSNGMAENFLNQTLTKAQRITDKVLGHHKPLFMMPEDHDRKDWTAKRVDLIQSEGWHNLIHAMAHGDPDGFFNTTLAPWFFEVKATDTHDTGRGVHAFGGDLLSYGRYVITTMLSGGPFMMMMGSEYGEMKRTNFKAAEHVPSLYSARIGKLADSQIELNRWIAKAGHIKAHPAVKTKHIQRMYARENNEHTARTIAFAKHPDHERDNRVLVFSNAANQHHQGGYFGLDEGTRTWLDGRSRASNGEARFQVRNLLSDDPNRHLWSQPKTAGELINDGVFVQLPPYQIQALELIQV
jgi:hypothetical protein